MLNKKVKSIILAAGKGTRMKSEMPKVLHSIFNKPLLGYVIDAVNNIGYVDESFIIVGHEAEKVENFVNKNYERAKCILQSPQLGTGDAVNKATPYINEFDGYVIVVCGDTPLITADTLRNFIEFHDNNSADLTVMSAIFENPKNYGRIIRDRNKKFVAIVEEKDATPEQKAVKEINAGIYCITWNKISDAFKNLKNNNAQGEYYLTDIVKWAVEQNLNVQSYILDNNEEIFGINSKVQLAEATKILNRNTDGRMATVVICRWSESGCSTHVSTSPVTNPARPPRIVCTSSTVPTSKPMEVRCLATSSAPSGTFK